MTVDRWMGTRLSPSTIQPTTPHNQDHAAVLAETETSRHGTKLEKNSALRSRLHHGGVGSGVKGQDERQTAAPLTPLPTHMPHSALDSAAVVADVKPFTPSKPPHPLHPKPNKILPKSADHFPVCATMVVAILKDIRRQASPSRNRLNFARARRTNPFFLCWIPAKTNYSGPVLAQKTPVFDLFFASFFAHSARQQKNEDHHQLVAPMQPPSIHHLLTVHGSRSTVHGPRSTVHGPRSTVHGPRSTVLAVSLPPLPLCPEKPGCETVKLRTALNGSRINHIGLSENRLHGNAETVSL